MHSQGCQSSITIRQTYVSVILWTRVICSFLKSHQHIQLHLKIHIKINVFIDYSDNLILPKDHYPVLCHNQRLLAVFL